MTNVYSAVMSGAFTLNTDQLAIEIDAPANTTIKIKKIRVTNDDGTGLTTDDNASSIDLIVESAAGTGTSSYTPIALDANAPASVSTCKIGPGTKGTVATTIDTLSVSAITDFLWQAADEDDKIVITPGSIFGIVINQAG